MSAIQQILGSGGNEICLLADNVHHTENGPVQSGLIFPPQKRQQPMTDTVPLIVEALIARILSEQDFFSSCELSQNRLRQIQQRTDHVNPGIAGRRIAPFHSRKTFAATAPKQPKK